MPSGVSNAGSRRLPRSYARERSSPLYQPGGPSLPPAPSSEAIWCALSCGRTSTTQNVERRWNGSGGGGGVGEGRYGGVRFVGYLNIAGLITCCSVPRLRCGPSRRPRSKRRRRGLERWLSAGGVRWLGHPRHLREGREVLRPLKTNMQNRRVPSPKRQPGNRGGATERRSPPPRSLLTRPPSTLMEASNTDTTTSRSKVRTPVRKSSSRVMVASLNPSPSPTTACMSRLSIIVSA